MYQPLGRKLTFSQPKPGHSRRGKDAGKRQEQERREERVEEMEETPSNRLAKEKENEKEEIKHSTEKGLDAGFIKIFLQSPQGCKPLVCSSLVLDTYCQWEPQGEPLSHTALHAAPWSLCTAGKNLMLGGGKLSQLFFLDLFLWKVLSLERQRPVKMTGYAQ